MKQVQIHAIALLAVFSLSVMAVFASSAWAQSGPAPGSVAVPNTAMGPYRSLAALSYQAFQKGDLAMAATLATILEDTWDKGEESGGYRALRHVNRESFEQIDEAMDQFIKPLIGYLQKAPNSSEVKAAYEIYIGKLKAAETNGADATTGTAVTPSGLTYTVLRRGDGRRPARGEIMCVVLTGFLGTGEPISSGFKGHIKGTPDCIRLGAVDPAGLDEGLARLRVGDQAILTLPPTLAYGSVGAPGFIPPNSALVYFVEVTDVKAKDLSQIMDDVLKHQGAKAAVAQFIALRAAGFPDIFFSESEGNELGYDLLNRGETQDAITAFRINSESYPHSANAYDSLAEALKTVGDKDGAMENYRKALSIDPKMESSAKALAQLQQK
jgi:FKBP-type peptidyl-prolyl cis-trans isomerase